LGRIREQEAMRAPEELKMDKTIGLINDLAIRVQAFPHNGLLKRINYKLVADTDDLYNFLIQVEKYVVEVEDSRRLFSPNNPDQLSLF
jgi:hypothetical protein